MRRQLLVRLAVQLGQSALAHQLPGRLLEQRCKRLARPAPVRPHIHQQRQIALDLAGVVALFQFKRFAQQDFSLAAPALRVVVQALGGNAVEAVAVGAGDEEWVGHDKTSSRKRMILIWRQDCRFSIVQCLTTNN
ncbi:hypothetical protein EMIT0P258_30307 [Pseudomonas sp. IT-P258]